MLSQYKFLSDDNSYDNPAGCDYPIDASDGSTISDIPSYLVGTPPFATGTKLKVWLLLVASLFYLLHLVIISFKAHILMMNTRLVLD